MCYVKSVTLGECRSVHIYLQPIYVGKCRIVRGRCIGSLARSASMRRCVGPAMPTAVPVPGSGGEASATMASDHIRLPARDLARASSR